MLPSQRNGGHFKNAVMGCIPSKQKVLDGDSSTTVLSATKEKQQRKQKGPPSPVIGEDAAPWVKGHRVLSHKDGTVIITEGKSA
ncbi:hypothetical protein C8Q73DRAFT_834309 [Cubamyces lactineus]|nr:hypothetical protein C8Q73DRAFT_834309 [Cubamyces lactineus]